LDRARPVFVDHLTLTVSDLEGSRRFYEAALDPLGIDIVELGGTVCFGPPRAEDFCIKQGEPVRPPVHVAFLARDRETVDRFHAAGLAAGGRDNGAPGLRPQYHAGYYGAYLLDPDGNNVEAVFHDRAG
jgi:catechol 2,3-dioxygenase-like lactoylglutathione lyase family enzyme